MRSFPDSIQDEGYLVTERMYSVTKHVIRSRDLSNQGMSNNGIRHVHIVSYQPLSLWKSMKSSTMEWLNLRTQTSLSLPCSRFSDATWHNATEG